MNNRVFLKTISFLHSGVFVGVFCSSFVTEITKDQKLIFSDFYKTTSFYVLLFLLFIEIVKNVVVEIITKKNNEIERLSKIIAASERISLNNNQSDSEIKFGENLPNEDRELSLEEIKIYTKKKIIDSTSNNYNESVDRSELARLDDILRRFSED